MGYASLDSSLSFPDNNLPPNKKSILITDTLSASGNFLIHHFIVNQIKSDKHVVLVGFSQTFNHYLTIGRKLGVNLTLANQKGLLSFIDGLTSLYSQNSQTDSFSKINSAAEAATTTTTTKTKTNQTSALTCSYSNSLSDSPISKESLQNFYKIIKQIIETRHSSIDDSRVCLIFDDLSVLIYSGFNVRDILGFVKACRMMIEKYNGSLIMLVHADEDVTQSSLDDELGQEILLKSLIYQSEYLLSVRGLGSGFSKDVSGEITIARGPRNQDKWFRPSTLHYKILDNNVQFFVKGFSQVVL
ncbi:elongator complex protein 6 [Rhizophagus clarus]|uniref:Elongator complex protein 6 n=1 Tax=Rhizophagus clarus TaxID=94130 RepID=A0A8H3KVS4_9GLOM|nr:elongator complex protein 6 [Rhizophagus clarus]